MKRFYILPLIAATALVACNKTVETAQVEQPEAQMSEMALNFGAYVNRGTTTKAGLAGILDTDQLKLADQGFGVFAYYNNGELYNETAKPDFMYNQHVTFADPNWTYSPVRYWPNEFGSSAISEEVDRLSFFAYAPWTQVTPSTGVVTGDDSQGIIGMSRNTSTGDPLVKYAVNFTPLAGVDLCWGVVAEDFHDVVEGATQSNALTAGKPWLNVVKPKTGSKIKFDFKHALASLNIQIDADIDEVSHSAGADLVDDYTRIYVRSVSFEGFTTKGALNLNSEYDPNGSPSWFDLSGTSKLSTEPVSVYDGRRDGKEGVETGDAKNEKPADLNPKIVQSKKYTVTYDPAAPLVYGGSMSVATEPGVTNTPLNLFNNDNVDAPIFVIPTDDEDVKITIVYDVETADPTLSGYLSDGETHGVSVENAISNTITLSSGTAMKLIAGKKYTIKLHLGMTSVKFDAFVSDWADGDVADTDLPHNTYMSMGDNQSVSIDNAEHPIAISISGLTQGSTVAVSRSSGDISAPVISGLDDSSQVTSSGMITVSGTVSANTTGSERAIVLTVTETLPDSSTKVSLITINQEA